MGEEEGGVVPTEEEVGAEGEGDVSRSSSVSI